MSIFNGGEEVSEYKAEQEKLAAQVASKLTIAGGEDSEGETFTTLSEMWEKELGTEGDLAQGQTLQLAWYTKGAQYYDDEQKVPSTVDGVLVGFGHVSDADIVGSKVFIMRLKKARPELQFQGAVELGAGIGRVVKNLLLPMFQRVDLVEQSKRLLDAAPEYIGDTSIRCGEYICIGMQDFEPTPGVYDLVWIQWVIGHLTDVDFVGLMKRLKLALNPGGVICLKENIITHVSFSVDHEDSCLTRSKEYYYRLFELSGLTIAHEEVQKGMPDELYPIYMWALV
jgi:protein N-terminal methyltransferase